MWISKVVKKIILTKNPLELDRNSFLFYSADLGKKKI